MEDSEEIDFLGVDPNDALNNGVVEGAGPGLQQESVLLLGRLELTVNDASDEGQRLVMQQRPDGGVGTLNLLDSGLFPYTLINGSTFPAADPALAGQISSPSDPDYLNAVMRFVRANAADAFDGHQVNFGQTFFNTVSADVAFPTGAPDNASTLLAGFDLELWGLPTSRPAYDPANKHFVYLRFQRGIMHYDAGCNCTQALLLADYLKSVLLNQSVPVDLEAEAQSNPFLAQWAPASSLWIARPAELNATDLTGAFVNVDGIVPPAAPQRGSSPLATTTPGPSTAPIVTPAAAAPAPVPGGYDVSFPQCSRSLPQSPVFAIVGVNGGRVNEPNPCLTGEARWALASPSASQSKLALYLNTGNPGSDDDHWPPSGTATPRGCDGSASADCAYDFGWYAAQEAFTSAARALGPMAATLQWWLDVETSNRWSGDTTANSADLEGGVAFLKSIGVTSIGLYSGPREWAAVVGVTAPTDPRNAPFASLFNWVYGARGVDDALGFCANSFTGGRVMLVQYPADGFDGDYACPPK